MGKVKHCFWLIAPIAAENCASELSSANIAASAWSTLFAQSLAEAGHEVRVFSQMASSAWPYGPFWCSSRETQPGLGFSLASAPYLNVVGWRHMSQVISLKRQLRASVEQHRVPDALIAYNTSQTMEAIRQFWKREQGSPFIWLVADQMMNPKYQGDHQRMLNQGQGAIFLAQRAYKEYVGKKIQIEGGVTLQAPCVSPGGSGRIRLLYCGSTDPGSHAGLTSLVSAMPLLQDLPLELLIMGKKNHQSLKQAVPLGENIKWLGFVPDTEIGHWIEQADFLINPRRTDFLPNQYNFPSKILNYLAWKRPIISTWTDGMPEDYRSRLLLAKSSSPPDLAQAIRTAMAMTVEERQAFAEETWNWAVNTRSWEKQIGRLVDWINQEFCSE